MFQAILTIDGHKPPYIVPSEALVEHTEFRGSGVLEGLNTLDVVVVHAKTRDAAAKGALAWRQ